MRNRALPDDLADRLKAFLTGYDKSMPWGGVTKQYRLRGVLGFIAASAFLSFNVTNYIRKDGWTQCKIKEIDYDTERERSFFQCSRTLAFYFDLSAISFLVFISGHLLLASVSFFWAYCCLGIKPNFERTLWTANNVTGRVIDYSNDAAFLLHLLENTGCCFVDTILKEKERAAGTSSAEGAQILGDEAV